jgi:hypothetical protein
MLKYKIKTYAEIQNKMYAGIQNKKRMLKYKIDSTVIIAKTDPTHKNVC